MNRIYRVFVVIFSFFLVPGISSAEEWSHDIGVKAKLNYRYSQEESFPVNFPPGAALSTVDPGGHAHLSVITLNGALGYGKYLKAATRVDFIDLYDRNPTSEDKEVDIDALWVRLGKEVKPYVTPSDFQGYFKAGKFRKFERQDDRHLESYGLVSTAFNRFEDNGMEAGLDLTPNLYMKASLTAGNPVFIRDVNALAGDNGTRKSLATGEGDVANGIPVLYDAEVEDFDWDSDYLETGGAMGFRVADPARGFAVNAMAFYYERDLQDEVDLHGTMYGGDVDVLTVPSAAEVNTGEESTLVNGVVGDSKREWGANLWLYWDALTLFGQYVDQTIAGLGRRGFEVEASYRFKLPVVWSVGETPLFDSIAPAVRYSKLDPDFAGPKDYPAPSIWWDWYKVDAGARLSVFPGVSLTAEYAVNEFVRGGRNEHNDEFLATLVLSRDL